MSETSNSDFLHLNPAEMPTRDAYLLMTGIVVPRPIGWISTLAADGTMNVAPHSFFNCIGSDPVMIMFSSLGKKDTVRNAEATGDFVANIVGEEIVEPMNLTSADSPPDVSEFEFAQLTPLASDIVKSPRVAESPISVECKVERIIEVGRGPSYVVIGEIVRFHIANRVWRNGRVDPNLLRPVGRLAGSWYSYTHEFFSIPRPTWASLQQGEIPERKG